MSRNKSTMTHPTRRSFLKQTSAAASAVAFPTIVPASVRGASAPSKQVTLGAIGVGSRGYGNCRGFLADDVRFLAVADCFKSRRDRFAAERNTEYGSTVCTAYADYRELLSRDDIDGVVISTPDHWHVPIAVQAAQADKDMYVEKPLGVALAWALELRKALVAKNLIFQYGTQQRSGRSARTAMDLVRNGYVGAIDRAEVWSPHLDKNLNPNGAEGPPPADLDYDRWIGPAPMQPYRPDRCATQGSYHCYDYALGFIAGWGAHPLDILQWGLDRDHTSPVSYQGSGYLPPEGNLYNTLRSWDVNMKYADGLPVRFMSADLARPVVEKYHVTFKGDGTTFFGTEGWVSYSRGACYMSRGGTMENTSKIIFKDTDTRVYVSNSQARNFIDCMKSRRPAINPLESAIRSDSISHLSDIAIRTGRAITWDPDRETIVGDAAAAAMLQRPMRGPYTLTET